MDINWTSLLTGVAGGIIPAAVAYYMGKRNVEASLAINEAKIQADKEALEIKHEKEMKKLRYEERKKLCTDFLSLVSPYIINNSNLGILKIADHHVLISLDCPDEYAQCARQLYEMLINDEKLKSVFKEKKARTQQDLENIAINIHKYAQFYTMFIKITQKMLNEEKLVPPGEWKLNDFKGSVPLDYRKLIS